MERTTGARPIFVVSDSTGSTADRVVRAALVQFAHEAAQPQVWPRIRTIEEANQVVAHAAAHQAMLVYTLVNGTLRHHVAQAAALRGVRALDLLGPVLDALTAYLEESPHEQPGANYTLDATYFRRVEAMEFSVQADDGRSPGMLERAEIVLVGVSRTSKTPVAAYLSGQGWKVANVPLVMGIDPPAALFSLPPDRVFALTIDPEKLTEIRQRRIAHLGTGHTGDYADRERVFQEVRWALQLVRTQGRWPVIDVTQLAVEETAAEILKAKAQRALKHADDDVS